MMFHFNLHHITLILIGYLSNISCSPLPFGLLSSQVSGNGIIFSHVELPQSFQVCTRKCMPTCTCTSTACTTGPFEPYRFLNSHNFQRCKKVLKCSSIISIKCSICQCIVIFSDTVLNNNKQIMYKGLLLWTECWWQENYHLCLTFTHTLYVWTYLKL